MPAKLAALCEPSSPNPLLKRKPPTLAANQMRVTIPNE